MNAALTRTGGCLCGAVRFTAGLTALEFGACHCSMCQRISGGVNLSFEVPAGAMQIEGADKVVTYRSSEWAERAFCGICGANLWYRSADRADAHYAVGLGALDDKSGMIFASEICIDTKPDAYEFTGNRPRKTAAEVLA
ncbi:MAG: GFA family protein [Pararhodobacter sp.]